ncbi:MAG: hypothetical protein PHX43_06990 [Alphaproteobacteria bacterium]|nr:hypothetical protein [Alphaproteobacteria bacterium]
MTRIDLSPKNKAEREERVAEAMRENLRRRKKQQQARQKTKTETEEGIK